MSELEMHNELDRWFTLEMLDETTYVISEYMHREKTHCYLLIGENKALLIDTGLGVANIKEVVDGITLLPIMVVTTHVHWDHIGSHRFFEEIAVHELEKEWLTGEFPLPLSVIKQNLLNGNCEFPKGFCIEDYEVFNGVPQQILHDRDEIDLGNRRVEVIHTPGHTAGSISILVDDALFSGDTIFKGTHGRTDMPTGSFTDILASLKKLMELPDNTIVYPGHDKSTMIGEER